MGFCCVTCLVKTKKIQPIDSKMWTHLNNWRENYWELSPSFKLHSQNEIFKKLKNPSVVAFKICCLIVSDFHQSKKIMVTRENNNDLCVCVHAVPLMQNSEVGAPYLWGGSQQKFDFLFLSIQIAIYCRFQHVLLCTNNTLFLM